MTETLTHNNDDFQNSSQEKSPELSKVKHVSVDPEIAGQRLDNYLINLLKGLPKTRVYRIIRKGEVRVNKGRVKPDYRIKAGDSIRIPPMRLSNDPLSSDPLLGIKSGSRLSAQLNERLLSEILYEDEGLIVLNKPSGMAVHGGSGLSFGVIEALRILRPDCLHLELVHRLDRETSGCLMIAKRRSTLKWLHELLRSGQIEKRYWALVKGTWQGGKEVNQPLQKNQLSSGERMVRVKAGGQEALTSFKVIKVYEGIENYKTSVNDEATANYEATQNKVGHLQKSFREKNKPGTNDLKATLIEASPITGRTHQIRVHAEFVGSPVAGDEKYGDEPFNREMKKLGLSRLFLHAISISIPLPKSQGCITIEAPLEKGLSQVLTHLSHLSGETLHG